MLSIFACLINTAPIVCADNFSNPLASKNPTTATRETAGGDIFIGGLKVKAIDGVDSSKLRIKRSKFNN